MTAYSKTNWVDGSAPAIDATNLNKIEQGIFDSLRQDGSTTMSGQLVTTAGTVTTPAIAPTGDSNTGIFFPAADTIAFGEGGAEAMRINSSGQVGIGCDPTSTLEVKAAQGVIKLASTTGTNSTYQKIDNTGGTLTLGIDNSTGSSQFGAGNYAAGLWHSGNYNLTFGTNNSVRMTISGAGNVGIGTTSPGAKLDVRGVAEIARFCGTNTSNTYITFSDGTTQFGDIGYDARDTNAFSVFNGQSGPLIFGALLERMRITSAGNVGIGTTSPTNKLQIDGVTANTSCINAVANTTAGQSFGIALSAGTNSSDYALNIRNAAQTSQLFHITGTGNVGIGTASPTQGILSIQGKSTGTIGIIQVSNGSTATPTETPLIHMSGPNAGMYSLNTFADNYANWLTFKTTTSANVTAERMRIDATGYALIGYTSSNGAYPLQVNGQIFATSSTIATSDGRYKKDVVALDGALDIVKALNPVQFSWKDHPVHKFNTDVPTVGFIAQEVAEVIKDKAYLTSIIKKSECTWETETGEFVEREVTRDVEKQVTREVEREITETIDGEEVTKTVTEEVTETVIEQVTEIVSEAVKETHTEEFLGIAESNLIAILTKAVKELAQEVEALKAQLAK